MQTKFTQRYGCRHPFASAGMAFAGEYPEFVSAVSNAGGIGALGVGFTPAEELRARIHKIRAQTDHPFNINFLSCFDNDAQIRVCAEEGVNIVSFHWGHANPEHLKLLSDAGVSVWEQVGTVEDARRAVGDGVEAVIAQGHEAGGHNYGGLPTFVLVPTVKDEVAPALVLAAGGIVDGRGVAAALSLGADAVCVGTRLVASVEANVHDEHKRRIVAARGEDTRFSSIFGPEWPHFNPMRVIRNRVVDEYSDRLEDVPKERDDLPVVGKTVMMGKETEMRKFNAIMPTPDTEADWEEMPFLAGQGISMIHKVKPAGEIVELMMQEASEILQSLRL